MSKKKRSLLQKIIVLSIFFNISGVLSNSASADLELYNKYKQMLKGLSSTNIDVPKDKFKKVLYNLDIPENLQLKNAQTEDVKVKPFKKTEVDLIQEIPPEFFKIETEKPPPNPRNEQQELTSLSQESQNYDNPQSLLNQLIQSILSQGVPLSLNQNYGSQAQNYANQPLLSTLNENQVSPSLSYGAAPLSASPNYANQGLLSSLIQNYANQGLLSSLIQNYANQALLSSLNQNYANQGLLSNLNQNYATPSLSYGAAPLCSSCARPSLSYGSSSTNYASLLQSYANQALLANLYQNYAPLSQSYGYQGIQFNQKQYYAPPSDGLTYDGLPFSATPNYALPKYLEYLKDKLDYQNLIDSYNYNPNELLDIVDNNGLNSDLYQNDFGNLQNMISANTDSIVPSVQFSQNHGPQTMLDISKLATAKSPVNPQIAQVNPPVSEQIYGSILNDPNNIPLGILSLNHNNVPEFTPFTAMPGNNALKLPENNPLAYPDNDPSAFPEYNPLAFPEYNPLEYPENNPSALPDNNPLAFPEYNPLEYPENDPSTLPDNNPLAFPEYNPLEYPENNPSALPDNDPLALPENNPLTMLENNLLTKPENYPITLSHNNPLSLPENIPLSFPENNPLAFPENNPLAFPEDNPLAFPENNPLAFPEYNPLSEPKNQPISQTNKKDESINSFLNDNPELYEKLLKNEHFISGLMNRLVKKIAENKKKNHHRIKKFKNKVAVKRLVPKGKAMKGPVYDEKYQLLYIPMIKVPGDGTKSKDTGVTNFNTKIQYQPDGKPKKEHAYLMEKLLRQVETVSSDVYDPPIEAETEAVLAPFQGEGPNAGASYAAYMPDYTYTDWWTYEKPLLQDDCPDYAINVAGVCIKYPPFRRFLH